MCSPLDIAYVQEQPATPAPPWQCMHCTLLNDRGESTCDACGLSNDISPGVTWHCTYCTFGNVSESYACAACGFHDWKKSSVHPLHVPAHIRGLLDVGEESFVFSEPDPWVDARFCEFQSKLDGWPVAVSTLLGGLFSKLGFVEDPGNIYFHVAGLKVLWNADRDDLFDQLPGEPIFAFHGTNKQNFSGIFASNFDPTLRSLDDGWFGTGAYFTTSLMYAAHYLHMGSGCTTQFRMPRPGESAYVIGAWLKTGRVFQVTDMSSTGKSCKVGYDSHKAYVKPPTSIMGTDEFFPTDESSAVADEIVIFEQVRICPRFIIELSRLR